LNCNHVNRIRQIICFFLVFFITGILNITVTNGADGATTESAVKPDAGNIHTVSDKMIVDGNRRMAELIGNVKVSQGGTIINADQIKIFYREGTYSQNSLPANDESI